MVMCSDCVVDGLEVVELLLLICFFAGSEWSCDDAASSLQT